MVTPGSVWSAIAPQRPVSPAQAIAVMRGSSLVPLPLWSDVKRAQLPNGLTYYVMKNKKPENP